MRFLTSRALVFVCSALCIYALCTNAAEADSVTYDYRGNKFVVMEGEPGIFTTNDRVTGRFMIDCSIAHAEGTCANLPFNDYFAMGAVGLQSMSFSAGPASLPTPDGQAMVSSFSFSTDSNGQIVDWNIDLFLFDSTGIINVDTDNSVYGPIDSSAALGGGAVVFDDPGKWKTIGRPGKRSVPAFNVHNRTYGNDVGAHQCVDIPDGQRCADLFAFEQYDVKGTYQHTDLGINYWFYRFFPEGGWRQGWRWVSCQVGLDAIRAQQNRVWLGAMLYPSNPECYSDGFIEECDEFHNCDWRPWGFADGTEVTGAWIDPINTTKVVVNQTDTFYDPWSDLSHMVKVHCNESGGNLMADGGFSIGSRHFWFEGFDTPGWNHYWLRSCNDQNKAK